LEAEAKMDINDSRPPGYPTPGGQSNALTLDQSQPAASTPVSSAQNGATQPDKAVEMARMLSGIVQDLVRQLEEQEAQGRDLRQRVAGLEDSLRSHESLRQTLRQLAPPTLTPEDLQNMQRALQALAQDPNHIMVLASVAQQARQLLDVVSSYSRVHEALK
jgi:vacuolar-type H+-ATPase subunit I/STV1